MNQCEIDECEFAHPTNKSTGRD